MLSRKRLFFAQPKLQGMRPFDSLSGGMQAPAKEFTMQKILALTALFVAAPLLAASADEGDKTAPKAPYVHSVIFYLKKDTAPAKRDAMIADCHKVLGKVPTVRGIWAGEPAAKGTPDVAVKDYQVGLLVLFENYDGLKTYLDHPEHLKFVEIYGPSIEKVLVYDFADKAK
jgi:hypothetical protein